jgi:hypothetical protein
MPKLRYEIDGRYWIAISRAAKLLGTNAQGVRKLMGEGTLEWRQTRANSRTFVVDEAGVMTLKKNRPPVKLKRSPDPLTRPLNPEPERRVRGGLWEAHHLRLTLPQGEEDGDKRKKQ